MRCKGISHPRLPAFICGSIEHLDKSTVVRRLLSKAVQEWLIENALEQYRDGKITIGKAADMVGIPFREMIAIAAKKGIPFQYSLDDHHLMSRWKLTVEEIGEADYLI